MTSTLFVCFGLVFQVAMATAAKAKLLLRELKTVKADLAFAKARSSQLEEENKLLRDREGREKGQSRADDDLVCIIAYIKKISLHFQKFKFQELLHFYFQNFNFQK